MEVYRPQYLDKKSGRLKHTKTWYYEFIFAGRLIKESAKTGSKTVAKEGMSAQIGHIRRLCSKASDPASR